MEDERKKMDRDVNKLGEVWKGRQNTDDEDSKAVRGR